MFTFFKLFNSFLEVIFYVYEGVYVCSRTSWMAIEIFLDSTEQNLFFLGKLGNFEVIKSAGVQTLAQI